MTGHARTVLGLSCLVLAMASTSALYGQQQAPAAPQATPQAPSTQGEPTSVADIRKKLGDPVTVKATVTAIDYDTRVVVLRDADGSEHSMYVGQDVTKLKNVKVGDVVSITYYVSLASNIVKPGETATAGSRAAVGTAGSDKPGGAAAYEQRWLVKVDAVDPAAQTVTVTGEKGRTFTFKVDDKAKLQAAKPGDQVEVIFTAAAVVSVVPASK